MAFEDAVLTMLKDIQTRTGSVEAHLATLNNRVQKVETRTTVVQHEITYATERHQRMHKRVEGVDARVRDIEDDHTGEHAVKKVWSLRTRRHLEILTLIIACCALLVDIWSRAFH